MTIGQVADRLDVSVQTLRYYEREGLLPHLPRSDAGYRLFDEEVLKRVAFIKHAQEVGFSLREIGELLSLRADPDGSCRDIQRCDEEKIGQLQDRLARLRSMKRTLENLVTLCTSGLPATACPILEALDEESASITSKR